MSPTPFLLATKLRTAIPFLIIKFKYVKQLNSDAVAFEKFSATTSSPLKGDGRSSSKIGRFAGGA